MVSGFAQSTAVNLSSESDDDLLASETPSDGNIYPAHYGVFNKVSPFLVEKFGCRIAAELFDKCEHYTKSQGSFYKNIAPPKSSASCHIPYDDWASQFRYTPYQIRKGFSRFCKVYLSHTAYQQAVDTDTVFDIDPSERGEACPELEQFLYVQVFDRKWNVNRYYRNHAYCNRILPAWQREAVQQLETIERIRAEITGKTHNLKDKITNIHKTFGRIDTESDIPSNSQDNAKTEVVSDESITSGQIDGNSKNLSSGTQKILEPNIQRLPTEKKTTASKEATSNVVEFSDYTHAMTRRYAAISSKVEKRIGNKLTENQRLAVVNRIIAIPTIRDCLPGTMSLEHWLESITNYFVSTLEDMTQFTKAGDDFYYKLNVLVKLYKTRQWSPDESFQEEQARIAEKTRVTHLNEMKYRISTLRSEIEGNELLLMDAKSRGLTDCVKTFELSDKKMRKRLADLQQHLQELMAEDAAQMTGSGE